jgi:hypothetical protein
MIRNQTARKLMQDWHDGQSSAMYAAASSGLVESFVMLANEVLTIDNPKDRQALLNWVQHKQTRVSYVYIKDRNYGVLPWVSKA